MIIFCRFHLDKNSTTKGAVLNKMGDIEILFFVIL